MSSIGIDASLAILRQGLEAMQKQDKALYSQLLTLRDGIRGLKTELKHEREQCEEAFKDLEEIAGTEFEDDVFLEGSEQNLSKTSSEKIENAWSTQDTWKHDRQDSGISVKTPEAENQESRTTTPTSKHHTYEFVKSSASRQGSKPELISHSKQEFSSHVKTVDAELPQKKTTNAKPVLIQHNSQDSGILIDEDAVRETSLLSKLVESPEMLEKLENRKFDRIVQKEWMKIRGENSLGNRGIHHQRSRSSNDLLKSQPHRTLPHQYSTPSLQPRHSHTNSCPQNTLMQFTTPGNELANSSVKQFNAVNKVKAHQHLSPNHSRTSSCPQNVLKQFTARDVHTYEKPSTKRPNELGKVKGLKSDEKQHFQLPVEVDKPLKMNEKLENSLKDDSLDQNHQRFFTTSDRAALSLALKPGNGNTASKSVFKHIFTPQHHHTRSLPTTPVRELIVAENLLNKQGYKRSMQNISECQVVTSKQVRPRKRSASYVDMGSVGGETDVTLTPRKASLVQVDSLKQGLEQGKVSPKLEEKSFISHQVIENDSLKQTRENDMLQRKNDARDSSQIPRKANVVQVDSFSGYNQVLKSNEDLRQSKENSILTSHKAVVVQVNSVPQGGENIQNKARVVHVNRLKQLQENTNLTQNQADENGELKASKPLRAVLVSATEVNVSNITDKQPLSRRCSLDERAVGNHREGAQRRFTITNFKTERLSPRPQAENGKLSPRFLAPKNHLRHHTTPEYDVIRRRHSLYTFHGPSKSWDGYATRRASEIKRMVRSASQVSLV
ncbi:Hypothetical predicted protein [Paramuricea clavata]|uniref:Uncharacterized protein n=1 Tax=Paramuricea clavata TaxID=317549 RepID=A0A6S7JSE5_PARCT|nr:Hypothetical predicted protein [Paramuricea clavata]